MKFSSTKTRFEIRSDWSEEVECFLICWEQRFSFQVNWSSLTRTDGFTLGHLSVYNPLIFERAKVLEKETRIKQCITIYLNMANSLLRDYLVEFPVH